LDEKYTLVMDETQSSLVGQNLRVLPRNLRAEDGDRGINAPILYSFDATGSRLVPDASAASDDDEPADSVEQYIHLNPTSGELRLIRQWPAASGLPLMLVVRATQADNRDRYALTTLTIVRSGPGGQPQGGRPAGGPSSTPASPATPAVGDHQSSARAPASAAKRGIEFVQERLLVEVAEDTPVNEKIARVRARHLPDAGGAKMLALASQQLDVELPAPSGPAARNEQQVSQQQQQQQHMRLVASGNSQAEQSKNRPINYQILDDQMDQFGINGLGEIFLKRPLDYEQRQELKIRVLATYTKYSDICHVQVVVLNVNDNKPKVSYYDRVSLAICLARPAALSIIMSERSARLGSARLGSARLGSARLGSARLGPARLERPS
jgi:hypothetical protein